MAINRIQVNTGQLSRTATDMSSDVKSIRTYVEAAFQDMQELDAMWEGSANQAFNVQFQKDKTELLLICDELEKYIDKIEYARDEYNKCENTVAEIINAIRV